MNNHCLQSCGSCHHLKDGLQPPLSSYTKEAITASSLAGADLKDGLLLPLFSYTKEAITASRLAEAVTIWKTVSRLSMLPVFDGNTIFSVTCRDGVHYPVLQHVPNPFFSLVAVVRGAITAPSLQGGVITRETVSRSGTAATSSTGPMSMMFQRGKSSKLVLGIPTGDVISHAGDGMVFYVRWCIFCCFPRTLVLARSTTSATRSMSMTSLRHTRGDILSIIMENCFVDGTGAVVVEFSTVVRKLYGFLTFVVLLLSKSSFMGAQLGA